MRLDTKNRVFTPFGDFYIDVENLFDQVLGNNNRKQPGGSNSDSSTATAPDFKPPCDVTETETAYHVQMDLPGVSSDDVSVELLEEELKIAGTLNRREMDAGEKSLRSERPAGSFARVFAFSHPVDEAKIEASFHDGVLEVLVPKAAKPVATKISIQTGTPSIRSSESSDDE